MESESYDDVMSGRALMRNLDKMNAPKSSQPPLGCPYCANELEVQFMDDAPRRLYVACYCHQCLASVCIEKPKAYELLPPDSQHHHPAPRGPRHDLATISDQARPVQAGGCKHEWAACFTSGVLTHHQCVWCRIIRHAP